ncbi:MAG: hypothetical protein GOU98_04990 [Candidatus Altiarchaeota archaeon]|nr:hypothetical protein [Candidatus Altiarchaeota archaeon]
MGITNVLYPFVTLISLFFVFYHVAPNLSFKKKDTKHILIILVVVLLLHLIRTPEHIVFGEFVFMDGAKTLSDNFYYEFSRPPGPAFLYVPLVSIGVSAFFAANLITFLMHSFVPIIIYFSVFELTKKRSSFFPLIFATLIPWVRVQNTSISEISAVFFISLAIYFLILYLKKGLIWPLVTSLSYYIHTRPESFIIAIPLVFFLSKDFKKYKVPILFLLFNFLFAATHMLTNSTHVKTWELDIEKRMSLLKEKSLNNLLFFMTPYFFNPLIFLVSLFSIWKFRQNKFIYLTGLLFLLSFLILSSFDFSYFMTTQHSIRYSLIPTFLLFSTLYPFAKSKKLSVLLLLFSLGTLVISPVLTSCTGDCQIIFGVNEFIDNQKPEVVVFSPINFIKITQPKLISFGVSDTLPTGNGTLIRHTKESLSPLDNLVYKNCKINRLKTDEFFNISNFTCV